MTVARDVDRVPNIIIWDMVHTVNFIHMDL
jgi:hypothetical protein